jgi:hypothetical protein
MRNNVKQLIGSLVLLLICIILTTQAGATMNALTATRLGNVDAGQQEAMGEENVAAPIVLWSKDTTAKALYLGRAVNSNTGSGKMTIDYLESPANKGLKERLKNITGAYPITDSAHGIFTKEDVNKLNDVMRIYAKDINGDGIDELVLIRRKGGVEVYDREKQIHKYKPKSNPKHYKYEVKDVNFTSLGDHDEIFLTLGQEPDDREKRAIRDTWVVRVSPKGITEIHPVFADHSEPAIIESVVAINRPGSKTVDELAVISMIEGRNGYFMSRHNLDGKAIDAPREIYVDYNAYCNPIGISGSNQFIVYNVDQKMMYFVTPDKPVNWIKTINLKKLFGEDGNISRVGDRLINNIAVVVLEVDGKLYALDALGKFHTSMKADSHISNTPVAFMTLKPDSNKHKIIEIKPTDKTLESYLVIQSRDPGKQTLSLEELEKAGKRYLTDSDWKSCREELRLLYFADITPNLAKSYCRDHNIPVPEIHSWEDIKKKLPGYYEEEVQQSKESYRSALETRLFRVLERDGYLLEDIDYKNFTEYKKWLNSMFVAPELVVSIQHISKSNISHQKLTDYYFKDLAVGNWLRLPSINVRTSGEHGRAFMALRKKLVNQKDIKPAYYTIAW